ncbi:hypothetical protein HYALB_00002780 [Hymenoscyphus albidus]|uniref:superoxide dismutase n=1 Tax=Hymenoscyphus albidus TaxID=595503 RepID=A0A9N9PT29_9HELO|nr:hypothetical protein HYALB_00002780 [Hymenoscyphus albidus]
MHATTIATVFLTAFISSISAQNVTTGALGNATVVENNPPGVTYVASLPEKRFFNPKDPRGNVKGSISATANPNGIGVTFNVEFENLPLTGGPFSYHIHVDPVPADGNCTKTLAHLDPFIRGEVTPCNRNLPQTCQVGDLSGKTSDIRSDPFQATYIDDFASTTQGLGSFFGNRSFVLHYANKTRITCANFVLKASNTTSGNVTGTPTGAPSQYTGGAVQKAASLGAVAGVMVAALLL